MKHHFKQKPPVIILGGSSNALAIARTLGMRGIPVYLSVVEGNCACYTRYAQKVFPLRDKKQALAFWAELLLENRHPELSGSVIFPCNDDGVEFVARYRSSLAAHYLLDESVPEIQLQMLNKRDTLELARAEGIPIPRFIAVESEADIEVLNPDIQFPLLVKPQHSHLFQKAFNGQKLFLAENKQVLDKRLRAVLGKGLKVIVSEMIPGPDSLLASYYTYLTPEEKPLFHFTKRVLRRYPKNNGQGCYHITEWVEEVAELGLRFFKGIQFRGLGNIEFKKDLRDGQWKVIECNPRFTAAHELLIRCGMDISLLMYFYLTGLPAPALKHYQEKMTLWYPRRDYLAYKELKALNELDFAGWLKSIARSQVLPHFKWRDPLPTLQPFWNSLKKRLRNPRT